MCYVCNECNVKTDGKTKIDGKVVCERHFNKFLVDKAKDHAKKMRASVREGQ